MPKATVKLPNGTIVEIDGSAEEVERLLAFYGFQGEAPRTQPERKKKGAAPSPKSDKDVSAAPTEANLATLVNLVRTCDEAEAIEAQILDRTSEVNRVLLPLYIAHEYMEDAFGLTTVDIAAITTDLGIRIFRQNVLRALKGSGARYVVSDRVRRRGQATRYRLNPRGTQYLKGVIRGGEDVQ
jgi:hypothetical protein